MKTPEVLEKVLYRMQILEKQKSTLNLEDKEYNILSGKIEAFEEMCNLITGSSRIKSIFHNNEEFFPIKNHVDYLASKNGNIYSLRRKTIMIGTISKAGYRLIIMSDLGIKSHKSIHRIIAETFVPNPNSWPCVNHINGIKTDNRADNLEWCTQKQNIEHAIRTGLKKSRNKK